MGTEQAVMMSGKKRRERNRQTWQSYLARLEHTNPERICDALAIHNRDDTLCWAQDASIIVETLNRSRVQHGMTPIRFECQQMALGKKKTHHYEDTAWKVLENEVHVGSGSRPPHPKAPQDCLIADV